MFKSSPSSRRTPRNGPSLLRAAPRTAAEEQGARLRSDALRMRSRDPAWPFAARSLVVVVILILVLALARVRVRLRGSSAQRA